MSNQPLQDERPTTLMDVVIRLAVLTEQVSAMKERQNNTAGNISLIISALVLLLTFGSKIPWT